METAITRGYNPPIPIKDYKNPDVIIVKSETPEEVLKRNPTSTGDKIQILQQEHPVYTEYSKSWMDWYNWFTGDNMPSYIRKHPRERQEVFKARKDRAYYFNYVKPIISLIGSFLFSRAITRSFHQQGEDLDEIENSEESEFWDNIDLRGTNVNDFMRQIFTFTKIFGYVDVVIDMPQSPFDLATEQQRLEVGLRPYAYYILPPQMINWETDDFGDFLWVRWKEKVNKQYDPFTLRSGDDICRYTTWTREAWYIDEVITPRGRKPYVRRVDTNEHDLGIVPVVRFYGEKDLVIENFGRSLAEVLGQINVEVTNLSSLLQEEIYSKIFNLLCMKDPNEGSEAEEGDATNNRGIEIGQNNVLFYTGEIQPNYLAPATDPGQFIVDWIGNCIAEIYRIANLGYDTGVDQTKSGVSYSYEFNNTNRMLADNADRMQDGEEKVHKIFMQWLGRPWEGYVDYPDSFDVGSYQEEINSIVEAKNAVRSETFGRELEKKLSRKMLARASAAVADKIMTEIDNAPEKKVIPLTPRVPGTPPRQRRREQTNRNEKAQSVVNE